jgi:hypothetical protein
LLSQWQQQPGGLQAQNYEATTLGHELWHAYQFRKLGGAEYDKMYHTESGENSLERGAIAFENYLASVLYGEETYVRRKHGIGGEDLWYKIFGFEYFNYYNERVVFKQITPDNATNLWQYTYLYKSINSLGSTPPQDVLNYYYNLAADWIKP